MSNNPLKYCLYLREDLGAMGENFFEATELYGMRSDLYMYKALKIALESKGISLATQAVFSPEESDAILCINETAYFKDYQRTERNKLMILILSEPPVYNKRDWDETRHKAFDKVLTYDPDLASKNKGKYVHFNYPIDFSVEKTKGLLGEEEFQYKKGSCLIAGAFAITQTKSHPSSLLYERYKVLSWYNNYAPDQLDYYGRTDPEQKFRYFRGASLINKISTRLTGAIARRIYLWRLAGIYKGPVPGMNKNKKLSEYKFNFCFENSTGLKGYITEKLFDCFFSGTVPVYYGAPDVESYIPKSCYILYTDFDSISALQDYLAKMDYNHYIQYLKSAAAFLSSPAALVFSTDKFVEKTKRALGL